MTELVVIGQKTFPSYEDIVVPKNVSKQDFIQIIEITCQTSQHIHFHSLQPRCLFDMDAIYTLKHVRKVHPSIFGFNGFFPRIEYDPGQNTRDWHIPHSNNGMSFYNLHNLRQFDTYTPGTPNAYPEYIIAFEKKYPGFLDLEAINKHFIDAGCEQFCFLDKIKPAIKEDPKCSCAASFLSSHRKSKCFAKLVQDAKESASEKIYGPSQNNYLNKEIEETKMEITRSSSQIKKLLREKTKNKIEVENVVFEIEEDDAEAKAEEVISVPKENINICFVGGVSTGKSTILNAIFCEQLTQCKIKRTTMVPTVYIENQNTSQDQKMSEKIFNEISKKNKEIIDLTERGVKLTKENYSELVFNVGKLDINILPDSFVNVYDIPGLNDARTKDVYYDYLETNFYKFNLVIFIVDIHSGLNTSDEIDIVNFITRETRHQLEVNGRKIFTLVVVNKADDMVQDEETKELHLTGELKEMYDQVQHTITSEFERKDIAEHLIGILPLCALDSYLYRMVKKHGSQFKLSEEQILKIGVNEMGKQFSKKKKEEQEKKVKEILQDSKFIDDMIDLSGFGYLERKLHEFLHTSGQGKEIRISNLLYELKDVPSFKEIADSHNWVDLLCSNLEHITGIYNSIKLIDEVKYNELFNKMSEEVECIIEDKVNFFNEGKEELLALYDNIYNSILQPYLLWENNVGYPDYFVEKIVDFIDEEFSNRITAQDFYSSIIFLKKVNAFNKENLDHLFHFLLRNHRENESIDFSIHPPIADLVALLKEIHALGVSNLLFLTRFLIINNLGNDKKDHHILWNHIAYKTMYYQSKNEVAILTFLRDKYSNCRTSFLDYCYGLEAEKKPCLLLDDFYLDTFCSHI